MQQEFRPRIKDEIKDAIVDLAKLHSRTPTQETNVALRHYIGAHKPDVDQVRQTAGQPTRKEG